MEGPPRLSERLGPVFSPQQHGMERRHLQPLAERSGGLMQADTLQLPAWTRDVHRGAGYAPGPVRRWARGLAPRGETSLSSWRWRWAGGGRPTGWGGCHVCIVEGPCHGWGKAWSRPVAVWRRTGRGRCGRRWLSGCPAAVGQAGCWHEIDMPQQGNGPIPLARGRPPEAKHPGWCGGMHPRRRSPGRRRSVTVTSQRPSWGINPRASSGGRRRAVRPTPASGGVASWPSRPSALGAQGTALVAQGQRRGVDAQGFRGQSYLKIGWRWVTLALSRGAALTTRWRVAAAANPAPAMASTIPPQQPPPLVVAMEFPDAVA
jgi:hypothetical protein